MQIINVKQTENGYLVNDTIYVPNVEGNRHYKMVQEAIANGVVVEPEFTEEELLLKFQADFRGERNNLLGKVDIEINKVEDANGDTTELRVYRQALRDATIDWVMPESIL